jgi:transposase
MGRSLSNDQRIRVVEAVKTGSSRRAAAARFGAGESHMEERIENRANLFALRFSTVLASIPVRGPNAIALRFGVGVSSAIRWVRAWRERGDVDANKLRM